jgi:hypothetical protein
VTLCSTKMKTYPWEPGFGLRDLRCVERCETEKRCEVMAQQYVKSHNHNFLIIPLCCLETNIIISGILCFQFTPFSLYCPIMNYFEDNTCPVCSKTFRTPGGKRAHLSSSESCSWYRFQKLGDMQPLDHHLQEGGPLGVHNHEVEVGDDGDGGVADEEEESQDMDTDDITLDFNEELSHFIPQVQFEEDNSFNDAPMDGLGPSTQTDRGSGAFGDAVRTLDDHDDSRVVDVHPSAGYVIRQDETLYNKWRRSFGDVEGDGDEDIGDNVQDSNPYTPFASKLDWRIAQWAVKDGPGQNAFDRLLKIPGVRSYLFKQIW